MKEYICLEVPTENGGYIEIETELIRCKDCRHAQKSIFREKFKQCDYNGELKHVNDFCSWAEPKETGK